MNVRITNDKDGRKILDVKDWGKLYILAPNGDMYYSLRGKGFSLIPMVGLAARMSIWQLGGRSGVRIPWREENGQDLNIPGFRMHKGELSWWYICEGCEAVWPSSPTTAQLIRNGCQNQNCPQCGRKEDPDDNTE